VVMASPPPADHFSNYRDHIQELIQQRGFTNNEVIADLRSNGFETSLSSLKTRLQAWGIRRDAGVVGVKIGGVSDELAEVQHQVENAILNGPARTFGRRWFITYLRQQLGFRAGQEDVANTQRLVDTNGVVSRLLGLQKIRLKNYLILNSNFLWCLNGHDKFSQYKI
jgi:hypothetical protein